MNCMKIIAFTLFAFAAISFTHAVQNSDEEEEEIAQNDPFDEESEEEGGDIDRWEEEAEDEMANADETHLEDDPTPFVGPTGPMPMFHPYPPNLTPDSRCPGSVGARLYPDQAAEMRATFHHIINIVSDQHLPDIHRALHQVPGVRLLLGPSNSSVGGRQPFTVILRGGAPFIFLNVFRSRRHHSYIIIVHQAAHSFRRRLLLILHQAVHQAAHQHLLVHQAVHQQARLLLVHQAVHQQASCLLQQLQAADQQARLLLAHQHQAVHQEARCFLEQLHLVHLAIHYHTVQHFRYQRVHRKRLHPAHPKIHRKILAKKKKEIL